MPKIKILDKSLVNKIAAGEVIERPSSVVKELVENSLDSGADDISVEVFEGGKAKIIVSDNGDGMDPVDANQCFKLHATSKISNDDDLFNIHSLGFRGEALASIAEVSQMRLITKTKSMTKGIKIELEGGKIVKEESIVCSKGTKIEVEDLFFNIPARKKYLKNDDAELNSIIKIFTKFALINKNVSIKLFQNGKEIINSPKTDSLKNKLAYIYGAEVAKNMIEVDYSSNDIHIYGFISKPTLTRADKSDQSLFVNLRYVKNNIVSEAVYDAYHTLLFVNRHPVFVLNVQINPHDIDVNVHPAKEYIRFKNEGGIRSIVYEGVKKAFQNNSLIVDASVEQETKQAPLKQYSFSQSQQSTLVKEEFTEYKKQEEGEVKKPFGPFFILGQINKTFIIAESPVGLAIIDQHAVQERINYEKFMKQKVGKAIVKQKLMAGKVIELSPLQYQFANNNKELLEILGFSFSDFGNNSVKLISIPEIFGRLKSTIFIDILNQIKENAHDKEVEERIIRFACRASVKAGEELTKPEMAKLLAELEYAENPYSCPHGRPTIIQLTIADLEKKFKRSGW